MSKAKRPVITNTIEEERVRHFHLTKKIGVSISGMMIFLGLLLVCGSIQYFFHPFPALFNVKAFLTPGLVIIMAGVVGFANLLCGLILLTRE